MDNLKDYQLLKQRLSDRRWRLTNLYYITDKQGNKTKFVPNQFQLFLLDNMWYLNVILKARQLGISTFIVLFILDACLFNSNQTGGIIDYTLPDAKKKLDKARFAYNNLPDALKQNIKLSKDNEQELSFSNGSSITADTTFRGSTLQYLHISEHAKICKKEPIKAREIKNGALNAVATGQMIFIESTSEDGEGDFFDICQVAEKQQLEEKPLSKLDFKFIFFPWYKQAEYQLYSPTGYHFSTEMVEYFADLYEQGIVLTNEQKYWYIKKKEMLGADVKKEYPTTPTEAFEASMEDKYYRGLIDLIRGKNQICEFNIDPGIEIDLDMDLGRSDYTSIIFSQKVGKEIRIVDFIEGSGEALPFYIDLIKRKDYLLGTVWLPHDATHDLLASEKNIYQQVKEAGFKVKIVKKLEIEVGINEVRKILPNCWFKRTTTEKLVEHVERYSKKWNDQLGIYTGPKHDEHSHAADAFRGLAVRFTEDIARAPRITVSYTPRNSLTGY